MAWPSKTFDPPGWEDQYQMLGPNELTDEYVRQAALDISLAMVGIANTDPRMYEALYPWDPEWARKDMCKKQSKCALVLLAALRGCGMELPEDGKALAWRFGAVHPPLGVKAPQDPMSQLRLLRGWEAGSYIPAPGCGMIIRQGTNSLTTHALMVEKREGDKLHSTDGGTGKMRKDVRTIVETGGKVYLQDKYIGLRQVIGIIDPAKMREDVVRTWRKP